MGERIETRNFGVIDFEPADVILVEGGLAGFETLTRFVLVETEDFEPIKFLQSLDNPQISFPLVPPTAVLPDYRIELDSQQRETLALEGPEQGLAYSIVTMGSNPSQATANLFAPLVINSANMRASQIALFDSGYAVDEPLLRA